MKRIASFGIPRQICRGRAGSVFLLPLAVARCEAGEKPASKHALLAAGGWRPERGGGRGRGGAPPPAPTEPERGPRARGRLRPVGGGGRREWADTSPPASGCGARRVPSPPGGSGGPLAGPGSREGGGWGSHGRNSPFAGSLAPTLPLPPSPLRGVSPIHRAPPGGAGGVRPTPLGGLRCPRSGRGSGLKAAGVGLPVPGRLPSLGSGAPPGTCWGSAWSRD